MAVRAADQGVDLIEAVLARIRDRIDIDQVDRCEAFARQYYQWVPAADLSGRGPLDLYGAAVAHWNLAQQRQPGEVKVHVYNPDLEHDGWQSPHTVVQIVSDDMPFIVDSVTMGLACHGYAIDLVIHPVIWVRRDEAGRLQEVVERGEEPSPGLAESVLHIEVAREPDRDRLDRLRDSIRGVLDEVRAAVEDWEPMRERTEALIAELKKSERAVDRDEIPEIVAFLAWLAHDNFTYLGYREYEVASEGEETVLRAVSGSGIGILRGPPRHSTTTLSEKARRLARLPHTLVLTKANSRATIHRPAYLDYVGVKKFDVDGRVIGERRFLGLYTRRAYKGSAREIPLLRGKVEYVMERAGFPPDSHDAKALLEIMESYPRESLFQMEPEELYDIAMGVLGLGERQRIRLFVRRDVLDRFAECLVCIPRDRFNTEHRERVGAILLEAFGGSHLDWTLQLSESLLARVYYIVHAPTVIAHDLDVAEIERRLVAVTRAWTDDLRDALVEEHGEEHGMRLLGRYEPAFPPGYRSDWVARSAVVDIARIEELRESGGPIISLYRPLEVSRDTIRCKLFSAGGVSLSDVLPTFEHMGTKVVDERPYEVAPQGAEPAWIYDFGLRAPSDDLERLRDPFQDAFLGVWRGELEDDRLNGLVLAGGLTGRQITIIRATAKYLRQAGIAFSDTYMQRTMLAHAEIAKLLVGLFEARFHPDRRDPAEAERIGASVEHAIDAVESLDQDRILRNFLAVIRAVLRTNYFRLGPAARPRAFLALKLDPSLVPLVPLPRPRFEIFVYSPQVEGVHLRGGKVARGGLRWSDRREDFRTEVLGLMKAQMVKNALIVPVGSKGGFVVKRPPAGGREALAEEATNCYRTFLRGLLDVTDNIVGGEVVPPERVVRYDEDDPYLVVAADKGTASFSDIANEISAEYGFWLGDAFASGGSRGYDHKQMGITARGAWESVKRHFRELGTDIQSEDVTVVGIGDMSGDVFGNGMLLSRHIKLVAAFNHRHVFLDPHPNPEASYRERERLFKLPQSGWDDYDRAVLSEGGGIYPRTTKAIRLSPPVKAALAIEADELSPVGLIRAILRAPVDLVWNGGIGTYVKAAGETHADAGDKSNDALRLDGAQLRCRVVGEGGNLGFTQRGRIEYAQAGGRINTDAIDNVAGVNCSDHEVNIKILLDSVVAEGDMTEKQRNELLVEMTDGVADRVIYASYVQTQALSLALAQAGPMIDVHARLIRHLEQTAGLRRKLEFLPTDEVIKERGSAHRGLLAPEVAVLMAYGKIHLHAELLDSNLPEDEYLAHDLERYFPPPLADRFPGPMRTHRLRREIIATVVANQIVDRAGTTFAFRLAEETGAPASLVARGYTVAREVFRMLSLWSAVEALDNRVDAHTQLEMLIDARRLVERATRWLVQAHPDGIDIEETIAHFEPGAEELERALPDVLDGADRRAFDGRVEALRRAAVPLEVARRVAAMFSLLSVFDIVEVTADSGREQRTVMETYFALGARLELNWLRDRILELGRANRWQTLARAALRDDLYTLHRALTREVLEAGPPDAGPEVAIDAWSGRQGPAVERCLSMIADIKASRTYDMTTLPVAMREVRNLIRGGLPARVGHRGGAQASAPGPPPERGGDQASGAPPERGGGSDGGAESAARAGGRRSSAAASRAGRG